MMLKVGFLVATLVLMSGCTAVFGEDPDVVKAQRQAEQAQQLKHGHLQAELERLRSEVKVKKMELQGY